MIQKVRPLSMKNTSHPIVNKFVVVISLWLLAILGISAILAVKTSLLFFNIMALVSAIILCLGNALFLSLNIRKALRIAPDMKEKYNR